MAKGTVEKITKRDFVDQNGNEYYSVVINGKEGSYACKAGKDPYFIQGQEMEYEEEIKPDKNGTPRTKFKKPYTPNAFGGKKQVMRLTECLRMAKSNAIHAMVSINAVYESEVIKSTELQYLLKFSIGDISADITKWGPEHDDFITRLACVNNAAIDVKVYQPKTGKNIVERAEKFYQYITK
jgi:hypothetical protein